MWLHINKMATVSMSSTTDIQTKRYADEIRLETVLFHWARSSTWIEVFVAFNCSTDEDSHSMLSHVKVVRQFQTP